MNITLLDKTFEPYIFEKEIQLAIDKVASAINKDYEHTDEPIVLLSILNGAIIFSVSLAQKLSFPLYVDFMRVRSYEGTVSTGNPIVEFGAKTNINNKHVILIEDIVDTGITLSTLIPYLRQQYQLKSLRLASLFCKPNAVKHPIHIDYLGLNINNDFVVGCGLDYNGLGRNLTDLYKIVPSP